MTDNMTPFPETPREDLIDHTPLRFGKYRGKTPEYVADEDPKYLKWAYETVSQFPVCSAALYKDIGGKGVRATIAAPKQAEQKARVRETRSAFDDMDDDIPF